VNEWFSLLNCDIFLTYDYPIFLHHVISDNYATMIVLSPPNIYICNSNKSS